MSEDGLSSGRCLGFSDCSVCIVRLTYLGPGVLEDGDTDNTQTPCIISH